MEQKREEFQNVNVKKKRVPKCVDDGAKKRRVPKCPKMSTKKLTIS
jgi:hypothetical protein